MRKDGAQKTEFISDTLSTLIKTGDNTFFTFSPSSLFLLQVQPFSVEELPFSGTLHALPMPEEQNPEGNSIVLITQQSVTLFDLSLRSARHQMPFSSNQIIQFATQISPSSIAFCSQTTLFYWDLNKKVFLSHSLSTNIQEQKISSLATVNLHTTRHYPIILISTFTELHLFQLKNNEIVNHSLVNCLNLENANANITSQGFKQIVTTNSPYLLLLRESWQSVQLVQVKFNFYKKNFCVLPVFTFKGPTYPLQAVFFHKSCFSSVSNRNLTYFYDFECHRHVRSFLDLLLEGNSKFVDK